MIRSIICSDIVEVPADVLIYSTNVRLALTGGVGAALAKKFGISVQIELQNRSAGTGRQMADVGEVIETHIDGSPWKRVFHSIATDEIYHTEAADVRSILKSCLRRTAEYGYRSIVCSALGAGYGDLDLTVFLGIADDVCREFDTSIIESFTVVVNDPKECAILRAAAAKIGGWEDSTSIG